MNTLATNSNRRSITENPKGKQQPQQPQTAKEIIAANVKALIEQLEAGHSEALTAYLNAMKRCNISTQELGGVGGTSGCRSLHSQPVSARRRRVSDRIVTLKPDDVCEQSSPSDESTTAMKLLVQSHGSTLQGVFDR